MYREQNPEPVRKTVEMVMVENSVEPVSSLYLANSYHLWANLTNSYNNLDCLDPYLERVKI